MDERRKNFSPSLVRNIMKKLTSLFKNYGNQRQKRQRRETCAASAGRSAGRGRCRRCRRTGDGNEALSEVVGCARGNNRIAGLQRGNDTVRIYGTHACVAALPGDDGPLRRNQRQYRHLTAGIYISRD